MNRNLMIMKHFWNNYSSIREKQENMILNVKFQVISPTLFVKSMTLFVKLVHKYNNNDIMGKLEISQLNINTIVMRSVNNDYYLIVLRLISKFRIN